MPLPITRRRFVLSVLGLVAIPFGVWSTSLLTEIPRSPALLLADVAVGWSMIAAGLIVADQRPGNRIGPLAVVTGIAWFLGDIAAVADPDVAYWGNLAHGWFDPLFAIIILAYPAGRLVGRLDQGLAIGFLAVQGAWTVAKAILGRPYGWWGCPTCADTIDAYVAGQEWLLFLGRLETLALSVLTAGLLAVVVARWLRASGPARRRLAPVAFAGVVLAIGFFGGFLAQTLAPTSARTPIGELRVIVTALLRILVAVGLLFGILRDRAARGRIADLVVRLDGLPSTSVLQGTLRDALGDPALRLFRWDPAIAAYRDAQGTPTRTPVGMPSQTTLTVGDDGQPLLAIAHDPALGDDPGLVSAAAAAVRLAVENERLSAEVRTQLEAVRASRTRIVEAESTERRRIERDLHDGAQQRLVSLQIALQLLRRRLGTDVDPATLAELDASVVEAQHAIDEIRELARGVHPAILTESGLGPALEALGRRSAIPVHVDARLDRRLPAMSESTAYFLVAEALTNAARHAGATQAHVVAEIANERLMIVVSDDGVGGADAGRGTGLLGLEDRVVALGGTFRLDSPPGGGTRIAAELPCESS